LKAAELGVLEYGVQIRPDRPLGEYQLRGAVNGQDVDLNFYFGRVRPTAAMLAATQRQLDLMVVRAPAGLAAVARPAARDAIVASRTVDRTFSCETGIKGGLRKVDLYAESAIGEGPQKHVASADVRTNVQPTWRLAGVSEAGVELSPRCRRSSANVALTARGLSGGAASVFGGEFGCSVPRRVVIRVRAVFSAPMTLRLGSPYGFPLLFARGKVAQGFVGIRTPSGKAVAFMSVFSSGNARLFTSGRCT
jgi:hypothetical protein